MQGITTKSILRLLGVGAMVLGLAGPALANPPASNPEQPFDEILAQIAIVNDKLDDLLANGDGVDLRGLKQNWDKKLDSTNGDADGCNSDRFTCLFEDTVVRDNETGLVWERDPTTSTSVWTQAILQCGIGVVGGRAGWELPLRNQLASLMDTGNTSPALPTDHPFLNVQSTEYWSATTNAGNPSSVSTVDFDIGFVSGASKSTIVRRNVWCVRGGQVYDGQDVQVVIDELP